jgi:hypothetical protein
MFGPGAAGAGQFEQLFSHLRETVRDATEHTVDSEQMDAAREILERAARDIRRMTRSSWPLGRGQAWRWLNRTRLPEGSRNAQSLTPHG